MAERRKAHRYALNLPVKIRSSERMDSEYRMGRTRDISTRGVYFIVDEGRLEQGTEIDLQIQLPTEVTRGTEVLIHAAGKVVRLESASDADPSSDGVAAQIAQYEIIRQLETA